VAYSRNENSEKEEEEIEGAVERKSLERRGRGRRVVELICDPPTC